VTTFDTEVSRSLNKEEPSDDKDRGPSELQGDHDPPAAVVLSLNRKVWIRSVCGFCYRSVCGLTDSIKLLMMAACTGSTNQMG
jgi:hypothetical protein